MESTEHAFQELQEQAERVAERSSPPAGRAGYVVGNARIARLHESFNAMESHCSALKYHLDTIHTQASVLEARVMQRRQPTDAQLVQRSISPAMDMSPDEVVTRSIHFPIDMPSHQTVEVEPEEDNQHLEHKLWDRWAKEEYPDAFSFLSLAQDGGFSEVCGLYTHGRWFASGLLILFVVYNVYYVLELDCHLIWNEVEAAKDMGVNAQSPEEYIQGLQHIVDKFYISRSLTRAICMDVLGLAEEQIPSMSQVLGSLELIGLTFYLSNCAWCCVRMRYDRGFLRWYHTQFFFWELLPTLSVYSAMKLLNAIVPAILVTRVYERIMTIQEVVEKKTSVAGPILGLMSHLLVVIFSFIVGFDTFLLKLRVVSSYVEIPTADMSNLDLLSNIILPTIQFLVQALGIVQLGAFIRRRLYVFIFGGEDGILQEDEVELLDTWAALLAKRIYRDLSFAQFIAVMTSFSDEDFQSLVLNENKDVKEAELGH